MTTFEQLLEIKAGEYDDFTVEFEILIDKLYGYFDNSGEIDYETLKRGDKFEWIPNKLYTMSEFDLSTIANRLDEI
jgi:hypothetical protein